MTKSGNNSFNTKESTNQTILYYCLGGGLGHITRFTAFCHTLAIKPILITLQNDYLSNILSRFASNFFILPEKLVSDKAGLKDWILNIIKQTNPQKIIIDAFPGGILGELSNCKRELDNIEIEYIARILKLDTYQKRLESELPRINKIWQVEELGYEQKLWLNNLAQTNNIRINMLKLEYPDFNVDSNILLPQNTWLIIHSGSDLELQELYEFARDTALLEKINPNYVIIGQKPKPKFLPKDFPYYKVYPVTNLLKKASRVISGAGFNIIQQMNIQKEKHIVLPFYRALDDQHLRLKLRSESSF
ncbi:MAG: hypothetical protein J6Z11_09210 [Candidatus Riflebacteria bacterium]|nr:hypothetical protein [Candidatus Riflebacteria bacterium]